MLALAEPLECLAGDAHLFDRNRLQAYGELFQKRIGHRATHLVAVAIHENRRLQTAGYGEARRVRGFNGRRKSGRLRFQQADGRDGGVPPVLRALFRPKRASHGHLFMRSGTTGADDDALIHQEGPRAPGTNIDAKPHN